MLCVMGQTGGKGEVDSADKIPDFTNSTSLRDKSNHSVLQGLLHSPVFSSQFVTTF